jgi:hypothetical protein
VANYGVGSKLGEEKIAMNKYEEDFLAVVDRLGEQAAGDRKTWETAKETKANENVDRSLQMLAGVLLYGVVVVVSLLLCLFLALSSSVIK